MRFSHRCFGLAACIAVIGLVAPGTSLAGDSKTYSGSMCYPSGIFDKPHIVRRGVAAVNLNSPDSKIGSVICPIVRDNVNSYSNWLGAIVRINALQSQGDTRPFSCNLYTMDAYGHVLELNDSKAHSSDGYKELVLNGGELAYGGYAAVLCKVPFQGELRGYQVSEP